jgi:hypothetical protein
MNNATESWDYQGFTYTPVAGGAQVTVPALALTFYGDVASLSPNAIQMDNATTGANLVSPTVILGQYDSTSGTTTAAVTWNSSGSGGDEQSRCAGWIARWLVDRHDQPICGAGQRSTSRENDTGTQLILATMVRGR